MAVVLLYASISLYIKPSPLKSLFIVSSLWFCQICLPLHSSHRCWEFTARYTLFTVSKRIKERRSIRIPPGLPDADALVDPTERLEYEQTGVFDEILQAGYQKEVVHQHLKNKQNSRGLMTNPKIALDVMKMLCNSGLNET